MRIGKYEFIDKEFFRKYPALKDALKGDLLVLVEVEIQQKWHEIVILIEHKNKRENSVEKLFTYLCYTWLWKTRPVWGILFYTDDDIWKTSVPSEYWYGYHSEKEKLIASFDLIKLRREKSVDLVQKHTLITSLLALKADDRGVNREELIKSILQTIKEIQNELPDDKKLLIYYFLETYHQIPQERYETIQKEVENMTVVASTITEYFELKGEEKGLEKGMIKTLSELLQLKFHEKAENWLSQLPEYSESSLKKVKERILFEDSLESIFRDLEKKSTQ